MNWPAISNGLFDELQKIGEVSKKKLGDKIDKVVEYGVPTLGGAGIGKSMMDLSLSKGHGPSPRRKTIGALIGAAAGAGHHYHQKKQKAAKRAARKAAAEEAAKTKTADPHQFKGMATKKFLSKPGKTVSELSPKIGRMGVMPT